MSNLPRIRLLTIAAATLTLAGSLAPAQAAPAAAASRAGANVQGQKQSAEQDRQICAAFELTGTRLLKRVCRTAEQWEVLGLVSGKN